MALSRCGLTNMVLHSTPPDHIINIHILVPFIRNVKKQLRYSTTAFELRT